MKANLATEERSSVTVRKTNGETAWSVVSVGNLHGHRALLEPQSQSTSLIISPEISGLPVDGCTTLTFHQCIPPQSPFPSASTQMEGPWSQMVRLEALSWAPLTVTDALLLYVTHTNPMHLQPM